MRSRRSNELVIKRSVTILIAAMHVTTSWQTVPTRRDVSEGRISTCVSHLKEPSCMGRLLMIMLTQARIASQFTGQSLICQWSPACDEQPDNYIKGRESQVASRCFSHDVPSSPGVHRAINREHSKKQLFRVVYMDNIHMGLRWAHKSYL